MGMFDSLRCEFPLPAPDVDGMEFQTKTFDCQLVTYFIRADGSLWRETYADDSGWDRSAPTGLVRCADFTGEVRFYDFTRDHKWVEFSAYFKDGALQQMNLIADERAKALSA